MSLRRESSCNEDNVSKKKVHTRESPDTGIVNFCPRAVMGRVSRYKRIKPCDPFYRGPNKHIDKGHDLPPKVKDQLLSRSFRDFLSVSQTQTKTKKENNTETITRSVNTIAPVKENKRKKELYKEKCNVSSEDEETLEYKRVKGESTERYLLRVDCETNKRLLTAHKKFATTSSKRKEYLKKRKLKSKLRRRGVRLDEGLDFKDLQDCVKFGEVVKGPPSLPITPKKQKEGLLLCNDKLKRSKMETRKEIPCLKKQLDIATEREKVINLYRQKKKHNMNPVAMTT